MQVMDAPPDIRKLRADVTPEMATLIKRLLNKDPKQRFPNAQSLVDAIELIEGFRASSESRKLAAAPKNRRGRLKRFRRPRRR